MDHIGSLKGTSKFSKILEPPSGCLHHFHIINSKAPLTILEHFFNSTKDQGTLLDTPIGPQNGPREANFRGHLVKKGPAESLHVPPLIRVNISSLTQIHGGALFEAITLGLICLIEAALFRISH